jgi:hypothetical protein
LVIGKEQADLAGSRNHPIMSWASLLLLKYSINFSDGTIFKPIPIHLPGHPNHQTVRRISE